MAPSRRERIEGGLVGLLVGDALGVPYEFHPAESIPPLAAIEYVPPPGFRRAHAGIAPGTWSDDGAQALCLLASLLHCAALDLGDFSRRRRRRAAASCSCQARRGGKPIRQGMTRAPADVKKYCRIVYRYRAALKI